MRGTLLAIALLSSSNAALAVTAGVVGPNQKVRPTDAPAGETSAHLRAAQNEVEPFQIVLSGAASGVSVVIQKPIPVADITLYREGYYDVGTPSNSEGASGRWPDPLIPDVDTYAGEKRTAFPFDVPANESRVVWVDVRVKADAAPGDYAGELAIQVAGTTQQTIPISLHVGTFSLPSTATLKSAFGMGWSAPCLAHTGQDSCDTSWNEEKANTLRSRYLRSGLDHRFTISDSDFQPPLGASAAPYETHVMPYVAGTGDTLFAGAQLTAIRLDGSGSTLSSWISYAKAQGFFDRLFYYPVDEPGSNAGQWSNFIAQAQALHAVDASARIIITSAIQEADGHSATDDVDIFCPVINYLEDKPGQGSGYEGNQRSKYDSWLAGKNGRELWAYQSCMSHGCGSCGEATTSSYFTGWPNRVIDSSAVQNRAFPWIAFELDLTGELYFETTYQLTTAWDANGQCAFSGHGDGTLFYPGKPSVIGGTTDVPVESIRMKMIREGMEDYEYLTLAAQKDAAQAKAIAQTLFPHAYECDQTPAAVASARDQLFDLLDQPSTGGSGGSAGSASGGSAGSATGGSGGAAGSAGTASGGSAGSQKKDDGGCGCRTAPRSDGHRALLMAALSALLLVRRRRRRTVSPC
ncbi:MAG: DUF4091 domain-containing protein [Myxococcales bacterium]|nr:DUF4091 domain-containing protein [Myxococcales bacterium]MCB9583577.1 DUF4091 domain-containing protein [Polyangiaceae bacterium]